MKLFLSGGGSGSKSLELDTLFANSLDKSKPLLYIPIAIDKVRHPYPECLKWITGVFSKLGVSKIELWGEKELENNRDTDLTKFSGIYIGGGNTYYLLSELKRTRFLSKLEKIANKDLPIYGGSAGAIIFGRNISTSPDENAVNLMDLAGLNLVNGYSIFCHYDNPEEADFVRKYREDYNDSKTIALPENCGLFISNEVIEVVGPGFAFIPGENKTVKPKEKV